METKSQIYLYEKILDDYKCMAFYYYRSVDYYSIYVLCSI